MNNIKLSTSIVLSVVSKGWSSIKTVLAYEKEITVAIESNDKLAPFVEVSLQTSIADDFLALTS